MAITLDSTTGFMPTTILNSGKKGLKRKQGAKSDATLNGTGLTTGLTVTVLHPQQSPHPTIMWTGKTANSNGDNTQCTVELTEQLAIDESAHRHPKDDPTTVSVTADDGTTSSNTITPTIPVGT
jgi:hypothetical protein